MTRKPKAGLLPLYLELYDERLPDMRKVLEPFLEQVAAGLTALGVDLVRVPVCRKKAEVEAAVARIDMAGADVIVTLHLAYSPSLESAGTLARSPLPVVMCDATLDYDFGQTVEFERMLYNHGIHGVQDLASVLRRRGKVYTVAAGHVTESAVLARTADLCRAAYAARRFRETSALRIGPTFAGMGDFAVGEDVMRRALGIKVEQARATDLAAWAGKVTPADVDREVALDRERFDVTAPDDVHRRSVRVSLALRRRLEETGVTAFSMNFLEFDSPEGPIDTVPFLEASKAMARGVGYAGEGDVLTASLVGALAGAFPETTFTEIFCPDWKGNSLWLSHMGEISPRVAGDRPQLVEKPFPFTPARNPAIITCAPRKGPATFVNLAPGPDDTFALLVTPCESLGDSDRPSMRGQIRGWIRPRVPVAEFLEKYSMHGGTHHNALVMGDKAEALEAFAKFVGIRSVRI